MPKYLRALTRRLPSVWTYIIRWLQKLDYFNLRCYIKEQGKFDAKRGRERKIQKCQDILNLQT